MDRLLNFVNVSIRNFNNAVSDLQPHVIFVNGGYDQELGSAKKLLDYERSFRMSTLFLGTVFLFLILSLYYRHPTKRTR